MMDAQVNGSHARTYINRANEHHHAIVRLQEENARLRVALEDIAGYDISPNEGAILDAATMADIATRALS